MQQPVKTDNPGKSRAAKEPAQKSAADLDMEGHYWLELLSQSQHSPGQPVLKLPAGLHAYESELKLLLGRVFAGRAPLPENLALAQQMSVNWCLAKCRQIGIDCGDMLAE